MQQTPLYQTHIDLGAKMGPFGGFDMPIQYTGILEEHAACRTGVALFDICHMGEFYLSGPTAALDLEKLLSCTVHTLEIGQCRYGFLCNDEGGILDDQIVYRLEEDVYMMVVNAGTRSDDYQWISSHISSSTTLKDHSDLLAKIDIQGPLAPKLLNTLIDGTINSLRYFRAEKHTIHGVEVLVSRTGYSGEVGYELYFESESAQSLWNLCIDQGATPAGLGARDTLRLEMGLPLYGHELSLLSNPLETGYTHCIDREKEFYGKEALIKKEAPNQLVGILFEGRQKPRDGEVLSSVEGDPIGSITSGGFGPSLQKGIALAYVNKTFAQEGTSVKIIRKRKELEGTIASLPFYKEATARKKVSRFL